MSGKRDYFPNNWQEYKDSPDDMFQRHSFAEVMDWKVCGWELPSSVACIIRVDDPVKNKVKEYVYQKPRAAQAKIQELCHTPDISITICDHQRIHHLVPDDD